MKHKLALYAIFGLAIFFVLFNLDSPTGLATFDGPEAKTVNDVVTNFYGITGILFPEGACGEVARDLYDDIAHTPMDVKTGFTTDGSEKIASLNFVTDRTRRFGTIDLMYGKSILSAENADSMISASTSAIVSVPKRSRVNFVNMAIYGYSQDVFIVNRGRFSMPSMECIFVVVNGITRCECDAHSISGMEIAGITAPRPPPEEDYTRLINGIGQQ